MLAGGYFITGIIDRGWIVFAEKGFRRWTFVGMENGSGGDAFPTWLGIGIGRYPGALGEAQAVYFANSPADPREEYVADAPEYGFNEFCNWEVNMV